LDPTGSHDVAYDIWFNQTPTASGANNGEELMVWLNSSGGVQPAGSKVGNTTIDGINYDVWEGMGGSGCTDVSYVMTNHTSSVNNLNVGDLALDSIKRGYMQSSWWLTSIQFGFELWQGGTGLAVNSFSVTTNGSGPPASTTTTSAASTTTTSAASTTTTSAASTTTTSAASTTTSPGGSCKAAYQVTAQWDNGSSTSGGYTAQVTVTADASALSGWTVTWASPSGQTITSYWNANVAQSGSSLTATNVSYNGNVPAGASTTFGMQGTWTGTNAVPTTLTCT
jgi:cellulose 1,4-beta-cellobiosidase